MSRKQIEKEYIEALGTDEARREAYIALADEFDPMGATTQPELSWFEPAFVEAARQYALHHNLPLPWTIGSVDIALELVEEAKRREL